MNARAAGVVETPLQPDGRHERGLVVHHNLDPAVAGAGSGILLQLRREADGTDGSTALPEGPMRALLRFLDPAARPLLWQTPG